LNHLRTKPLINLNKPNNIVQLCTYTICVHTQIVSVYTQKLCTYTICVHTQIVGVYTHKLCMYTNSYMYLTFSVTEFKCLKSNYLVLQNERTY
jgi:hypothetical protein